MTQLYRYSTNSNLDGFFDTFTQLMERPHSNKSQDELRFILSLTLPFFIFEPVYTAVHYDLVNSIKDNVRAGNLNLVDLPKGHQDLHHFTQTLSRTTNIQAFDALYPVIEAIQNHIVFASRDWVTQDMIDQVARRQKERILHELDSNTSIEHKRKL